MENNRTELRQWRILVKYASTKARQFYNIYSDKTIAETSAMFESVKVLSKRSEKCPIRKSDNLAFKLFVNCEYLDLGGVYYITMNLK